MSREILFRGKKFDGEWIYGSVHYSGKSVFISRKVGCAYGYSQVNSRSIGQYTGKNDKNGRNIFEGDVLKVSITDDFEPCEFKEVVFWDEKQCGYCVREQGAPDPFPLGDCDLENSVVIGNIFDNPELMA